jgi:hypothetical protein
MADSSARTTAKQAAGIVSAVGLVGLVEQYGIGGVLYATFLEIIGGIQTFGDTLLAPFGAFRDGLVNLIVAVFPTQIIDESVAFTAYTITQGEWAIFGPFTFAVGVVATLAGTWMFIALLRRWNIGLFGTLLNRIRR